MTAGGVSLGRWGALVLIASMAWAVTSLQAAAHGGEDDVGVAELRATQVDGVATVRIQISQTDDCARFTARQLVGQRGDATVTGSLDHAGACQFSGTIALRDPGRWLVSIQLAYDGAPAEVAMPIGVSETQQAYTRVDWIHRAPRQPRFWERLDGLTLAAVGLLVGALVELARRQWIRRRSAAPTLLRQ